MDISLEDIVLSEKLIVDRQLKYKWLLILMDYGELIYTQWFYGQLSVIVRSASIAFAFITRRL